MIIDTLRYYSSRRAACKQWSVVLSVAILLIGAWGRLGAVNVVWAAAPLLFLGLAEAGFAAQERRCAELVKGGKQQDEATVFLPEAVGPSLMRVVVAVLSLSIWPFYLGLIGIVVAGSGALPVASPEVVVTNSQAVQAPVQPYAPVVTGPVVYPGQGSQIHSSMGQQTGQMPPGMMVPRQPAVGQNFPGRPPMTPFIARNPAITVPPGAPMVSPRPTASAPKPASPATSAVAPASTSPAPAIKP